MQLTAPVTRVQSLDVLRGTVMVLMAIDHVRVYSGIAPGGPDPGIFFTRWVTHFCAPLFVFLAGAAAYLYGQNLKELKSLSSFLLTRGFLLILLEFSIIRFCWTFNFDYSTFCLAGVIWMLGCSMIFLALLASLGPIMVGIIGLFIVFFQKIFQYIPQLLPEQSRSGFGKFWEFIYPSGLDGIPGITILYVLIPWIGVMAAGYWFGTIFQLDQKIRKKICFGIGLGSILAFIGIGSYMILSKPIAEDAPPFVFQLLNQKKYPASPLFLLMTIGPAITLIPWIEHLRGRSTGILI